MSANRPTKRERREDARVERARIVREQQRRGRVRMTLVAAGIVMAIAVLAVVAFASEPESTVVAEPPEGVQDFTVESRNHVNGPLDYPQDPPVGGDHNPSWLNCAAYDQPVPKENVVHDLEHGAVWLAYQPDLAQDQVETLKGFVDDTFVLVSPYPNLSAPVVASSWGHQLQLQDASDPRLQQFIRAFRLGPDTPELGAPCTGGIMP